MKSHSRVLSRLSRGDETDPTKRPSYVYFDLLVRTLSAVGLLALGIAGTLFQISTHQAREKTANFDRQSRRYLPLLRTLTELEVALDDTATVLFQNAIARRDQADVLPELSSRIDSAATSTLVIAQDPQALVELPDIRGATAQSKRRVIGVRSAAFMFSELLRTVAIVQAITPKDPGHCTVQVLPVGTRWRAIVHVDNEAEDNYVGLKPEAVDAWRWWLGDDPVRATAIMNVMRAVARALQRQVVVAISDVIREHPELGDQYVLIRAEVAKNHRLIQALQVR
jgi:hypothetical protein